MRRALGGRADQRRLRAVPSAPRSLVREARDDIAHRDTERRTDTRDTAQDAIAFPGPGPGTATSGPRGAVPVLGDRLGAVQGRHRRADSETLRRAHARDRLEIARRRRSGGGSTDQAEPFQRSMTRVTPPMLPIVPTAKHDVDGRTGRSRTARRAARAGSRSARSTTTARRRPAARRPGRNPRSRRTRITRRRGVCWPRALM